MSKSGSLDDELPPPYSSHQAPPPSTPPPTSSLPPSLFSSHLSALQSNLRHNQAAQATAREQLDNEALSLIIPHIEELLASIADIHPAPTSVEATIIPSGAVGEEWHPTERDEKLRGEIRTVIRVSAPRKENGDEKRPAPLPLPTDIFGGSSSSRTGFDEWGRWDEPSSASLDRHSSPWSWWEEESRARRLAKYLRPPVPVPQRQIIREVVSQKQAKSRWSLFKKDAPAAAPVPDVLPQPPPQPTGKEGSDESVSLSTAAGEVTFRRENSMGIWESRTGWGLMVTVRIRR